jgi:nitroreductase
MKNAKFAKTDSPVHELIAKRWSPYGFSAQSVSPEALRSLFEAARWAASSFNEQPWRFIVATKETPEDYGKLLSCLSGANQGWSKAAPVLALGVVSLRFSHNNKPNRVAHHDLGLATANLIIEATSRDLHVHPMAGFDPEKARQLFDIPEGFEPWTALAIGYASDAGDTPEIYRGRDQKPRTRKPISELVFGGRWDRPADIVESDRKEGGKL